MQYHRPVQWKMTMTCNQSFGDWASQSQSLTCRYGQAVLPPILLLLHAWSFSLPVFPLLLDHDASFMGADAAVPSKLEQTPDRWANAMITALSWQSASGSQDQMTGRSLSYNGPEAAWILVQLHCPPCNCLRNISCTPDMFPLLDRINMSYCSHSVQKEGCKSSILFS